MKNPDVIVVGAGACGLNAARVLSRNGKKVLVIEARNRIGGRIFTLEEEGFSQPVELGAEFIHGNLRTTLRLLKKAKIRTQTIHGDFIQVQHGEVKKEEVFDDNWGLMVKQLKKLKTDMTMDEFLETYFSDEKFSSLKNSVKSYIQGYDAADTSRASAFAVRDEMGSEGTSSQFRIEGGYCGLVNYLSNEIIKHEGEIIFSKAVKKIKWKKIEAELTTEEGRVFSAKKIIVTVPVSVLQASPAEKAGIVFSPSIPDKIKAAKQIGYGGVIKILLEFDEPFWKKLSHDKRSMKKLSFVFSKTEIPTWWTQYPEDAALLTGWLAGPKSEQLKTSSDEQLLESSIKSLSYIFQMPAKELYEKLKAHRIANWNTDPFSLGAYTYITVETKKARKILSGPEGNALFFAGEALYEGPEMGTIEAALKSGSAVAKQILKSF